MNSERQAHDELVHIGRMIAELERAAVREPRRNARHPVMRPDYWTRRIDALMNAASLTKPQARNAAALRERLASLSSDQNIEDV